jgi:hypothetical protein
MAKKYIDAELIKSTRALYFDIDTCITELIRARTEHNEENEGKALFRMEGLMVVTMQQLDCIIDSLQQEQPCDTCTNDKGCVTCKDGELWEGKPVEDLEKEIKTWIPAHIVGGDEAPWKELKGVVIQWSEVVARHFYILGLKNNIPVTQITLDELAKEGEPVSKDLEEVAEEYRRESYRKSVLPNIDGPMPEYGGSIKDAFIAGAEWQKAKMLKDAMEGEVCGRVYDHINIRFADGVSKYLEPKNISHIPADISKYAVGDKVKIVIVKEE